MMDAVSEQAFGDVRLRGRWPRRMEAYALSLAAGHRL